MKQPRIVVLDGQMMNPGDLSWEPLTALGEVVVFARTDADDVIDRSREADVLVVNKVVLREESLASLPRLSMIAVTATGFDQIDLAAAARLGIIVSNVPDYSTASVAEHVFALVLALARRVELHDREVRNGKWQRAEAFCYWSTPQRELANRTMGIVGWGQIGRQVGRIAAAMGMRVAVASRSLPLTSVAGVTPQHRDLVDLFRCSDVVSLHCPLTSETTGLVNRELLSAMKSDAFLVNTARGGLIVESDLVLALQSGWLGGAAVDVAQVEPMMADHPLLACKNCIVTPHLAWATYESRSRLLQATASNIVAFLAGRPAHVVNRPHP